MTLELLTESELSIFEEIIECPKCLTRENICNFHAAAIKNILTKNTERNIEKLNTKN